MEQRRGPFWDKYQRVQLGMTGKEVEEILGPPNIKEGGGLMPETFGWCQGEEVIAVDFDIDDRASAKRFLPETMWEELWHFGADLYRRAKGLRPCPGYGQKRSWVVTAVLDAKPRPPTAGGLPGGGMRGAGGTNTPCHVEYERPLLQLLSLFFISIAPHPCGVRTAQPR
jgi:hypothetical protein